MGMAAKSSFGDRLERDAIIILAGIAAAIALSKSGLLSDIFLVNLESELIGSFIAGILFTSLFTTPLAIATFVELAPAVNTFAMAGIGALGAVLGDLILFGLVRFAFRKDVEHVMSLPRYKRFFAIFHRRMFRWMLPFLGALIIASPLPDELGMGLMGLSHMRTKNLVLVSLVMNALGIALIGWIA